MFLAKLSTPAHWESVIQEPVFLESLRWIFENGSSAAEGIYEMGEPGWFVNVHGYTTQASELCTWENHPATIDIQYMIEGVEGIDVTPVETLGEPKLYKPASDTQKFDDPGAPATQVVMQAGDFVILLPGEAHRPKVAIGEPASLRKLVVKIPAALLSGRGCVR